MRKFKGILVVLFTCVFCVVTSTAISAAGEKTVLTFFQYKPEIVDQLDKLAKIFEEQNPNIKMEIGETSGSYEMLLKTKIASGNIPDVFAIAGFAMMADYADAGVLEDITDEPFMQRIVDAAKPAVTYDGRMYGIPLDLAAIGVIYNKGLFREAGIASPPKTVSDLKNVIQKIKNIGVIPFGVAFKDTWTLGHLFGMVHSATVDTKTFVKAMNAGKGTFWNANMDKVFETLDLIGANCNQNPLESDYTNQTVMFAQEKVAMMTQGVWAMAGVNKVDPDIIDVGMFGLPVSEDPSKARLMVDVDYRLGINPKSENVEEAKQFLDFMTTKTATDIWIKECRLISTVVGTTTEALGSPLYMDIDNYIDANKTYLWGHNYWPTSLWIEIGKLLQKYYLGELTGKQVCLTMDDLWKKTITE